MSEPARAPGRLWQWVRAGARDPVVWTQVLQVVKTVVAAVAAWVIAVRVFSLPQPFLAPWAALLVVHATVYRTFAQGASQVGATVAGVLLAWAVGTPLGLSPLSLGIVLLLGLVVGYLPGLRAEATTAAATALIVLTTGYAAQESVLLARLFDTLIGVGVGLLVNVVVWPPLQDYSAARAVDAVDDQVGDLMLEMAEGLRGAVDSDRIQEWVKRTQSIDTDIDHAWGLVRHASESGRYNPRRNARRVREAGGLEGLLDQIEQAVAEIRSMLRTVDHSIVDVHEWDAVFRDRWLDLVRQTGEAICSPDAERLDGIRQGLAELSRDFSDENLPGLYWTEYGSLILSLRNIVTSMSDVAASTPITPEKVRGNDPTVQP